MKNKTRKKEHDFLFKKLIETACEDLISITFGDLISWVDFSSAIKAEININDIAHIDSKLYADSVILAPHKSGDDKVVIVHIEFQSYRQKEYAEKFAQRMYQYHCRLYGIFGDFFPDTKEYPQFKGKKCFYVPLAILSNKCPEDTPTNFKVVTDDMKYDGQYEVDKFAVTEYNYRKKHLRELNWKEYAKTNNVAAIGLLGNMNHEDGDKPMIKLTSLKLIYGDYVNLDYQTEELMVAFVETYLTLDKEQQKEFERLLQHLNTSNQKLGGKIMSRLGELTTKWHIDGQKDMLIKNVVTSASVKFEIKSEEVKSLLEESLNKVDIDDADKIMSCLFNSSTLKDFILQLDTINNN